MRDIRKKLSTVFNLREINRLERDFCLLDATKIEIGKIAVNASKANRSNYRKLWDAEVKVFSQWGEDGILDYLFDKAMIAKPRIIEFGIGNFTECNSRFAAENRNACVYGIDKQRNLKSTVQKLPIYWKTHVFPIEDFITPQSAQMHLETAKGMMGGVDVLSLDIDGNDYWVLESLDLTGIKIVVCEYNPVYGSKSACTIPRSDNFDRTKDHYSWLHYGMSLKAVILLLKKSGLIFVGTNLVGNNAFFVRRKVANSLDFELPTEDKLDEFVEWRVRESRDGSGKMNHLSGRNRKQVIEECVVLNLSSDTQVRVKDLDF